MRYRYFDRALESSIELPELASSAEAASLRIIRTIIDEAFEAEWCHEWRDPNDAVQLTIGRTDEFWLMEFPGVDCLVTRDLTRILIHSDAASSTERHLLLDQVIPRVVAQSGRLVLHASAIRMPSGHVYLLAGDSGAGKSTLGAALDPLGGKLLADDCVLVESHEGVRCFGSYAGLRLFPDSLATLSIEIADTFEFAAGSTKRRVMPSPGLPDTGAVAAILFLSRHAIDEAELRASRGSEPLMALVSQRFSLDPGDHALAARHLALASDICRTLPCYQLRIPDDLTRLASACESMLELDAR